jgi:hypothetical protein
LSIAQQFGLPDLFFDPKKMGEFGFIQTVKDNINILANSRLPVLLKQRICPNEMILPSTADFRAIISAGSVPGSDVTLEDVKSAKVIWGRSVL